MTLVIYQVIHLAWSTEIRGEAQGETPTVKEGEKGSEKKSESRGQCSEWLLITIFFSWLTITLLTIFMSALQDLKAIERRQEQPQNSRNSLFSRLIDNRRNEVEQLPTTLSKV